MTSKIFIIGLPRTGTTSICSAMLNLGFTVAHTAYTQRTFKQAQVIADTPIFNDFQLLDKRYPNSRFIYLARDLPLWLPSIQQLLLRMSQNLLRNDGGFNPMIKRCYLDIFSPFSKENIHSYEFLTQCYQKHKTAVQLYFNPYPERLLTIDISKPESYQALLRFLNIDAPNTHFEKLNSGGKVTAWKDLNHPLMVSSTNNGRTTTLDYLN